MQINRNLAFCLLAFSLPGPAFADSRTAAHISDLNRPPPQTSMFVGTTIRLNLNRKHDVPRYRAALGIRGMARDPNASELQFSQGLELSVYGKQKLSLRLAGTNVGDLWQSAKLDGGAKTAMIAVGAAAVLGVVALVAIDSVRCEDEGNACD